MGRLFWKFFAFIWLAQIAGIVAIGTVFWLTEPRFNRALSELDAGPGARARVDAGAAIVSYAGFEAFKNWIETEPGPTVYAVDDAGHEALDRSINPQVIILARELQKAPRNPQLVRDVTDAAGRHYLLFALAGQPIDSRPTVLAGVRTPLPGERGTPPFGGIVATLLASLTTAVGLAWYVAKPIRSLRVALDTAAGGNLDVRVGPLIGTRQDELADLGRDFDRMADRLQSSMEGQRRLLHDVSHEVRSPLARLQAAAGLIRLKYGVDEPTVGRIEEEIVRIDRLVGDLLKLSRLEAGELPGAEEEIDLRDMIREIVTDANFEAHSSGRAVTWSVETAGTMAGRPEMLHGAIENVVRNALKHAPVSREVRLETAVDAAHTHYALRVLDNGPGVPEHELPSLFTPFFRAGDAARTEGYGLGLAIARRSIEAHGGTITASNRREGGLQVDIVLPLNGMPQNAAAPRVPQTVAASLRA